MSNKNQIGFSLVFWETLKEYDEKTKTYKPIKNKRVEVCQELSDLISDNEEVKNMLIDKMFGYKDDIKQMLNRGEYCDIPSYHKESLEKDQHIADLEAKLAKKEKEITEYKKSFTLNYIEELQSENRFLKSKEQDNIELLEKVKDLLLIETKGHPIVYDITRDIVGGAIDKDKCFAIIDTLISEIKGE